MCLCFGRDIAHCLCVLLQDFHQGNNKFYIIQSCCVTKQNAKNHKICFAVAKTMFTEERIWTYFLTFETCLPHFSFFNIFFCSLQTLFVQYGSHVPLLTLPLGAVSLDSAPGDVSLGRERRLDYL